MKKTTKKLAMGVGALLTASGSFVLGRKLAGDAADVEKMYAQKHLAIIKVFNQWMIAKHEWKSIADYLKGNGKKTVAIYGMSFLGERLYDELKDSDIEVKYAIDRNAESICTDLDVYTPEDDLPEVDVIIVTAVYFYDEIEEMLEDKVDCVIFSLEDIVYEM